MNASVVATVGFSSVATTSPDVNLTSQLHHGRSPAARKYGRASEIARERIVRSDAAIGDVDASIVGRKVGRRIDRHR